MTSNPSSALTAMKATLAAIQKIRILLESESHNLSKEKYAEINNYLSSIEGGINQEIGELDAYAFTQAPNLFEDDGDEATPLWDKILAFVNRR